MNLMVRKRQNKKIKSEKKTPQTQQNTLEKLDIPAEEIQKIALRAIEIQQQEFFSGPLPPSKMLREYEEILPGSADRIISLAENEQNLRGRDNQRIIGTERLMVIGSILVSLSIIIGIVICAYFGQPYIAFGLVAGLLPAVLNGLKYIKDLLSEGQNSQKQ